MSWIKFAVAGLALCAGASVASAQSAPPAGAPPMGGQRGERAEGGRGRGMQAMLFEGITLSDEQRKQIDEIRGKYREQMQALRPADGADAGPPDPSARAKMSELQEKQSAEFRTVLTADQQKVFDVNTAAMKKRREEQAQRDH
jgi:Spy/CpxP family protein refolding chaperone